MIQLINEPYKQTSYYHYAKGGLTAKIAPSLGGSLQELTLNGIPIIKGSFSDIDVDETYRNYCTSGILFPFPNRLARGQFTHENKAHQLPLNDQQRHAIHGCVFQKTFDVKTVSESSIAFIYTHTGNQEFSFSFSLEVQYQFQETGVEITFYITNTSTVSFPFGIGWHPYFAVNKSSKNKVLLEASTEYLTDEQLICNGKKEIDIQSIVLDQFLDSAYQLGSGKVTLETDTYTASLQLPEESFLQLFTPKDKDMVAIEPMSCIGNAFNNGVGRQVIAAGDTFSWQINLVIDPVE